MSDAATAGPPELHIEPWPSEQPLFLLNLIAALALWVVAILTIVGLVYGLVLGLFLFVMHLAFISHLRGNGVRIGPDQFPELHSSVVRLSAQAGLRKAPEAYVLQGGGVLNALATRFIGSDMIVLFSELLEACGDEAGARDMIIGHELGHLRRGHVRWRFVVAPAMLVPFLGTALSRAREYTCDRYGLAAAGDTKSAILGLSILAAGGRLARRLDVQALVRQHRQLNTGWMTLGEWLASHPPLVKRIGQIDPTLGDRSLPTASGPLRALGILALMCAPVFIGGLGAALFLPGWARSARAAAEKPPGYKAPAHDVAVQQVHDDLARLSAFIHAESRGGQELPWDSRELYQRWSAANPSAEPPQDPFDGTWYGYDQRGTHFLIWSAGPDLESRTADDVVYDSRRAAVRPALH